MLGLVESLMGLINVNRVCLLYDVSPTDTISVYNLVCASVAFSN